MQASSASFFEASGSSPPETLTKFEKGRRATVNATNRSRVRKSGGFVDETLDIFDVFKEENYICQICFEPCDPSLNDLHPRMATCDHIIAVSNGGSHTRDNVQTAHFRCNVEKSGSSPPVVAQETVEGL